MQAPLAEELLFRQAVNGGHVEVTLSEDGDKLQARNARSRRRTALLSHETDRARRPLQGRKRAPAPSLLQAAGLRHALAYKLPARGKTIRGPGQDAVGGHFQR